MKSIFILLFFIIVSSFVYADEFENTRKGQRNYNAIQHVYTNGVPHTDKQGNILTKYDKEKSFFTIGAWGVPCPGETFGKNYDWQDLKDAGFNTVWPYPIYPIENQLKACKDFDMQAVILHPMKDEELKKYKNNPYILGNCWTDEPIGQYGSFNEQGLPKSDDMFKAFTDYKAKVKKLYPKLKVFVNDCTWNSEPATSMWVKWNTSGDIQCQDAYPIFIDEKGQTETLAHDNINLPNSVALATAVNNEKKPIWLIVGPFTQVDNYGGGSCFRWPTANQLRSSVYAGIEQGATGIIFFIWDSFISREGRVIGMSPNPQADMGNGDPKYVIAKPNDLINSKLMWDTTCEITKELKEMTPYILSDTIREKTYSVDITGKFKSPNSLRCLLKPDGEGGYILFSTNIDGSWLKCEYTFDKDINSATALFENQNPIDVKENKFTIDYEPFETHIIHITK